VSKSANFFPVDDALSDFVHFKVVICNQLADFRMVPGCGREIALTSPGED
jgi:hypothetical protein